MILADGLAEGVQLVIVIAGCITRNNIAHSKPLRKEFHRVRGTLKSSTCNRLYEFINRDSLQDLGQFRSVFSTMVRMNQPETVGTNQT